jgi:hypothetical protein
MGGAFEADVQRTQAVEAVLGNLLDAAPRSCALSDTESDPPISDILGNSGRKGT